MTRSFSPTDKPRKRKPTPETPENFLRILHGVIACLERIEANELYEDLEKLRLGTVKGQSYESRVMQMDSDAVFEAAADLEDESPGRIPGPRSRDEALQRSSTKTLENMLVDARGLEERMMRGVGQPPKKRGRPSGWEKSA